MDKTTPYLTVAIATLGIPGIRRVAAMNLPAIEGVEYVVSWQESDESAIPESLRSRHDVIVVPCRRRGLGANRNNALDVARGEVVLMADDDLVLYADGLRELMRVFRENPELHYGSFRFDGANNKRYPAVSVNINPRPRHFHQTSFEIAIRRCEATAKLRFKESFGLGSDYFTAGEDTVFAMTARNMGLNCRFFPITIAAHPGVTTGLRRVANQGVTRTKGACITLEHPVSFLLRLPLAAYRDARAGRSGFLRSLLSLFQGAVRILADRPLWRSIRHPLSEPDRR